MYANAYTMRMPTNYVDMSADELEYDGGWNWFKNVFKAVVVGAVAGVMVAATGGTALPIAVAIIGTAGSSLAADAIDEFM